MLGVLADAVEEPVPAFLVEDLFKCIHKRHPWVGVLVELQVSRRTAEICCADQNHLQTPPHHDCHPEKRLEMPDTTSREASTGGDCLKVGNQFMLCLPHYHNQKREQKTHLFFHPLFCSILASCLHFWETHQLRIYSSVHWLPLFHP